MNFHDHSRLDGTHAFLSASKYHWVNYDEEKLVQTYRNHFAAALGSELHDWARKTILLKRKQKGNGETINRYINDAIGFKMTPEQILYYSENCYCTADAISFKNNFLRIHDLKTGVTPASHKQNEIYSAVFCLEYNIKPHEIKIETRIYQNDEVFVHIPNPEDIMAIMNKIILFDKLIENIKLGG